MNINLNGVAIFTNQGSKAREFVHSVEVGMVGINVAIPVQLSFYTFGVGKILSLVHPISTEWMALGFLPELKQSQPDGSMMMKQSISRCQRSNKKGILKC